MNSAWDHSRIGSVVDAVIKTREAAHINEKATEAEIIAAEGQD